MYGKWVDVVIDDRLPYWPDGKLVFCSNTSELNEMWGPLLEKAYAKLYGSYENMEGGQTNDALIDMSGGIQENYDLKKIDSKTRRELWDVLKKGFDFHSIMGCSIIPDANTREARMANGLVKGHAYTITKLAETSNGNKLIRIRNPWGNDVEWNGAWSDNSNEWNYLSDDEKQDLGIVIDHDGEFWMDIEDFLDNWDSVQICHLSPDAYSSELAETDDDSDLKWHCETYQSKWQAGENAGGCGQGDPAKFWTNPQFLVKLTDVDQNDNEDKVTLIVALMQKDTRLRRIQTGQDSSEEFIQFRLFRVKDGVDLEEHPPGSLRLYGDEIDKIDSSGPYINMREITKRFRVDPGNYIIIPSTYEPDHSCKFMLRVFTEMPIDAM
jgi:calpain, invertebrate